MPPFGEAHALLSPTHPDTQPPAAGADPSDGQVVTWSDALGAFHAADPAPGGVTDHGLLTGLGDDDHPHYALADKSRPSPWVAAADLAARSLADLGTKDHHLLAGLTDDDHPQYVRGVGRPGGQAVFGGTQPNTHLTFHSTTSAQRGYVRAQDDLQLLSNVIRDAGGNTRLTLATTSPHVSLTGDLDVSAHLAVGDGATPNVHYILNAVGTLDVSPAIALYALVTGDKLNGSQLTAGLFGGAIAQGTPTFASCVGLYFYAQHNSSSPGIVLTGIYSQLLSGASSSGAISTARGLHLPAASWTGSKPTTVVGVDVEQQDGAGTGTAYGLRVADQTATTTRLLELGPAVPYLRLLGGGNPAAHESNLYLKLGVTLKQVTEYDEDSAGVGYRALRVPN